jgi:hypothetical protein
MVANHCIGLRSGQADNALLHSNAGANHSTSMSQDSEPAASMPQVWSMIPHSSFNSINSLQPFLHTMLPFATISTHSA